jgi:two-component system sensor histidine kinase/response regulator
VARLLIVDDEVAQLRALCDTLSQEGYATTGFASAKEALAALRPGAFELILTDLRMPEMDGIALLQAARAVDPQLVGIVMTGHGAVDTAVQAMQAGALDYVLKPFRLNAVLPVLNRALAVRELRAANAALEQRIRERTRELEVANRQLETANKDLESFSFSISHDLQAPVNIVRSFIDAYMTDHATGIAEEGRAQLQYALDGAERMGRLIEDLLQFSRFNREPLATHAVSVAAIVARTVADLRAKHVDRDIEVEIGDLPECEGDPSLIEQVFVNLLSNAFKFTRDRHPARISIGCRQEPRELIYFVRDNGAGFDPNYAHKLFGVFKRLHSADEFEGTGVGLSIVHRIVERHGGRTWAESELDRGATFYCSVPRPPLPA